MFSDLDDDQWHRASILVDDITGRLNVSVDGTEYKCVTTRHGDVMDNGMRQSAAFVQPAAIFIGGGLPTAVCLNVSVCCEKRRVACVDTLLSLSQRTCLLRQTDS
jgi:hypothetical protein